MTASHVNGAPTNVRFGPDGCAYIADYGAVRDLGRSDPDTAFKNGADAALVQIPAAGEENAPNRLACGDRRLRGAAVTPG